MIRVQFNDRDRYELAAAFAMALGATADPVGLSIDASDALASLLGRLARGEPTALPVRGADSDAWVVMGAVGRDLEAGLAGVSRFVVPSYAEHEGGLPSRRTFDPTEGDIGRLGGAVYPAGHYLLRSPTAHFPKVLERLGRWAALEAGRPQVQAAQPPGYRDLYEAFSAALSAGTWDVAAARLDEIRRRGLATAENLAFLDVQLLAQQRRWAELWRREEYGDIARLRAPRAVKGALLAAFHQSELLPLEQAGRWAESLEAFLRLRGRLGSLLEGSADTSYGPALRLFAYRDTAAGDRPAVEAMAARAPDDETRLAVEALIALLPPPGAAPAGSAVAPALTPQQALRLALSDGEYGAAWAAAEDLDTPEDQARGMLEIAYLSDDMAHAEAALLQLWSLSPPAQEALLKSHRLSQIVAALGEVVSPPAPAIPEEPPEETPLTDWIEWLIAAAADADDPRLARSVQTVAAADDRYWTDGRVAQLADRLTELAAGGGALSRPHLREAVRRLRDYFLQDPEFPREGAAYSDVYEALYAATLEQREVNEATTLALLRLAEARLRTTPQSRLTVASHMRDWLAEPIPALGGVMLEALDLLAAYGAQGPGLGPWFRAWGASGCLRA